MFCSTVIPTVGRITLSRAVQSVLTQKIPDGEFELIIVNDSGQPLPTAEWQQSNIVRIIATNKRERSVARNTGAAMARGQYLHFLDDDDWLAPGAYQVLLELSRTTSAKWLYGMTQLINRELQPTIRLRHGLKGNCFVQAMAGEWIPLQASLIDRKTFLEVGGFNPLLSGPEDIDLLRRILRTEEVAETPHLIAHVIMGAEGSTTDYGRHPQTSRWAREILLNSSNVHERLRSSAVNSFWHGRMLRVYLTSAVWNLGHRRFFDAASRISSSIVTILQTRKGLLTRDFWRAVSKPYASLTFEQGLQERRRMP